MNKTKSNARKNFTVIPNALINDESIPKDSRFMFILLSCQAETFQFKNNWLKKKLNVKTNEALNKYWKGIEDAGWGYRIRTRTDSGHYSNYDYVLFAYQGEEEIPSSAENTSTGKTHTGKMPVWENTSMVKTRGHNKEELLTKKNKETNTKEESVCDPDSIPVSDYSTANMNDFLTAGDKCYENIHSRIRAYFTNEEKASALVESAGCKMDAREFNSELTGWIRHNMTRQEFYCNPIKFLRGGKGNFYSWISQTFKPYHKNSPARIEKELEPLKRPTAEQLSR